MPLWGIAGVGAKSKFNALTDSWKKLSKCANLDSEEDIRTSVSDNLCIGWLDPVVQYDSEKMYWAYGDFFVNGDLTSDQIVSSIEDPDTGLQEDGVDGIFFFVRTNTENTKLEILNDHTGMKSIYYIMYDNMVYFSSNPVQLAYLLKLSFNGSSVTYFLQCGELPGEYTLFDNILKLKGSSKLEVSWGENTQTSVSSKPYITNDHFKKDISLINVLKFVDYHFKNATQHIFKNAKRPLVDLTIGNDSRINAAYADKYSPVPVNYTTGLWEYEGAHKVAEVLNNVGTHINTEPMRDKFPIDDATINIDSILLCNGSWNISEAIMDRSFIKHVFSKYDFRVSGINGPVTRDFRWLHEPFKLFTGLPMNFDIFIRDRMNYYKVPSKFLNHEVNNIEIIQENITDLLKDFPEVNSYDKIDIVAHIQYNGNGFSGALSSSETNYPFKLHAPFAHHKLISLMYRTKPLYRLCSNLNRIILNNMNNKLCRVPTNYGQLLLPIAGKYAIFSLIDYFVFILKRLFCRIKTKIRKTITGHTKTAPAGISKESPISIKINTLVADEILNSNSSLLDDHFNREHVVQMANLLKENKTSYDDKLALERIATLTRLEKFISE
jgi:hypothetical protein